MSILEINFAVFPTLSYGQQRDPLVWKYLQMDNSTISFIYIYIYWTFLFLVDDQSKLHRNFIAKYNKLLVLKKFHFLHIFLYTKIWGQEKGQTTLLGKKKRLFFFFLTKEIVWREQSMIVICFFCFSTISIKVLPIILKPGRMGWLRTRLTRDWNRAVFMKN